MKALCLTMMSFFVAVTTANAAYITKIQPARQRTLVSKGKVATVRLIKTKANGKKAFTKDISQADEIHVLAQGKQESNWIFCRLSKTLVESKGYNIKQVMMLMNTPNARLNCEHFEVGQLQADSFDIEVFGTKID